MTALVNFPVPEPSDVLVYRLIVGLCSLLQTTPRLVTSVPPSDVTFPPDIAEELVTSDRASVVTVALLCESVSKVISLP